MQMLAPRIVLIPMRLPAVGVAAGHEDRLGRLEIALPDQQVDVGHRPQRKVSIHRFRQIRPLEHDHIDARAPENPEHVRELAVEPQVLRRARHGELTQPRDHPRWNITGRIGDPNLPEE